MKHAHPFVLALTLLLIGAACHRPAAAAAAAATGRPSRPERAARDPYLMEEEELKATGAQSLYDAVKLNRPLWLTRTVRNATGNDAVAVYLDERYLGSLSVLRELPIHVAKRLQYLAPTEARIRFGPQHGSRAAIQVESAKPDR